MGRGRCRVEGLQQRSAVLGHVAGGEQQGLYSLQSGQLAETELDDEAFDEARAGERYAI